MDFEKAMALRDPEFAESLEGFYTISALDHAKKLPKEKVRSLHKGAQYIADFHLFRECESV